MSKSAKKIIHPYVMEWATGKKTITKITGAVEHVRLCGVEGEASLLLICPATANTISKIASGIDDTTVTTFASTALGSGIPVAVVPAMHASMYKNPFLAANIKRLKDNGIKVVEPRMAEDKAKLADPEKIVKEVMKWI
jgi:phosphopantothenoylcysteine decarboxylase/phosphopantothenate--cysteine ligase